MGQIVVVTASAGSLPGLDAALREFSLAVEARPLLRFAEPDSWAPVDQALNRIVEYRAVALTSPRASQALVGRLRNLGIAWPADGPWPLVWAGGPATESGLQGALPRVRMPPAESTAEVGAAEALARAMLEAGTGSPVLFLGGDSRREELTARLTARGIRVDEVVCYRSILASEAEARAAATRADILVVTSPRVAELLVTACPPEGRPALVAVGPTTAASAGARGWLPAGVAAAPTVQAVVGAVQSALTQRCA